MAFSIDDLHLFSTAKNSLDPDIRVWSVASGECLVVLPMDVTIRYVRLHLSPLDDRSGSQLICSSRKEGDIIRTVSRWKLSSANDPQLASTPERFYLESLPDEGLPFDDYVSAVSRRYTTDTSDVEWILDAEKRRVCWLPESRRSLTKHLVPVVSASFGSKMVVGGRVRKVNYTGIYGPNINAMKTGCLIMSWIS